jgi:FtsP/CotA-like multicopper oxidase with cupredoxin domain
MMNRKSMAWWNSGLMLVLLCLCSLPQLAAGGSVPPIPTGPLDQNGNPATPDYYTTANWANSPPLAKFVDTLPGLGASKANNLGQYLSVAKPDVTTYPGSDYYEIELVEYRERMHSDLPAPGTLLRGYRQVNRGTNLSPGTLPSQNLCGNDRHACSAADTAVSGLTPDPVHYLGPNIISERDRPVRIKFTNKLPAGEAGNLFLPVDTTVMGAGNGPAEHTMVRGQMTPCDNTMGDMHACASYPQNRAVIHLHGGRTPWISDGTPHQWVTPAEEITPFAHGASLVNVPDMPDPGDGSATYYYTNAQSARLMFYHDHSFGITRLNVYAGEAAGYVITDKHEQDLVARGIIPPDQIPLIIQDKTFVDATPTPHPVSGVVTPKVRITDPLWNWGSGPLVNGVRTPVTGDLWLPHVYMPAQTLAAGFGGVNPFGRWMYGPWFYPATVVEKGPVPNPYYDADCSSTNPVILAQCQTPGQPTMIPGTPNVSMGMEAFQDSAVVNGTVFPTLTVDPRAYRFRILNAASDRFFNLSLYKADPDQVSPDQRLLNAGRSNKTEVKMLPASKELAEKQGWPALWPVDGRDGGVPDPAMRGPNFLQIASEGGFLPKPVEIEPQPITYFSDPTAFWVGDVDRMGLALGPAERADVIVDFSQFAGQTLILYNDAPAAWPARVGGYDYFTGAEDLRDSGGYGTGGTFNFVTGTWDGGRGPLVGYAPNTRTVMQIIVRATAGTDPAYSFDRAALELEFTKDAPVTAVNPAPAKTLFERAQEPIVVGQAAYKDAYPASYFPTNYPWEGISQINDDYLKFLTLDGKQVEAFMEPKGLHDEMGASFDPVYGRMSGNLAMQLPNPTTLNALLVLYGFSDLPTETINNSLSLNVQVVPGTTTLADGTQIWKISHNGVDTHPIHFHIFDVQVVNRVGWDGQILMPEPNELGWKDTVKISPLMDTIVAVRPRAPALPFGIPNSVRLLNPTIPEGSGMGFNSVDWKTGQRRPQPVTNVSYDFGWEYVWHCHILSHEEMDMMRPIVLKVATNAPPAFQAKAAANGGDVVVTWNDPTPVSYSDLATFGNPSNEIGYNVYRSSDGAEFTKVNGAPILANSVSYTDNGAAGNGYIYKVEAYNASGSTFAAPAALLDASVSVTNGPAFSAPATVNLRATVTSLPAGATVTQVAFYNGATLIGNASTPGASADFSWNNVPKGSYSVTALITDSRGGTTVSAPVTVEVSGLLNADFTVTGSANGQDLGFCETLTFNSSSTGAVTGYDWLINGTSYGVATVTTSLPLGSYPVTLAITNSGTGETAQVTKTVNVVNHNPTANAGGPYTVLPGNSLILNGSGSDAADPCGTAPMSYAWNIDNKGDYDVFTANATLSYATVMAVLGSGAHTVTFRVTDADGGAGTATTTVTVQELLPPTSISVPAKSTTGSFTVSWGASPTPGVTYTLEESTTAGFTAGTTTVVASGLTTTSAAISGKISGVLYYRVKAVQASFGESAWTVGANGCVLALPPSAVSLTSSPASPVARGVSVTFSATATGGSGPYEYEFMQKSPAGIWSRVRAYSSTNTWVWSTANVTPGLYYVQVNARTAGSTTVVSKVLSFTVSAPAPTSVALTASPASPQVQGTQVTFTGAAAGGSGSYEYEFYLRAGSGAWSRVRSFNSAATWVWNSATAAPGLYYIQVNARSVGSTATVSKTVSFTISPAPATSVTLTSSPASPQPRGTTVTFTGAAAGGGGPYEYEFYLRRPGAAWTRVRTYGSNASWGWATTGETAGLYYIQVNTRSVGSTTVVSKVMPFTLN